MGITLENMVITALGVWAVLLVIEFWLFAIRLKPYDLLMLLLNSLYPALSVSISLLYLNLSPWAPLAELLGVSKDAFVVIGFFAAIFISPILFGQIYKEFPLVLRVSMGLLGALGGGFFLSYVLLYGSSLLSLLLIGSVLSIATALAGLRLSRR